MDVSRKNFLIGSLAAVLAGCCCAGVTYVDTFDFAGATCGYGKRPQTCRSVDGNPLTVAGKAYARGFGTHPESAVMFRANGKVTAFDALVAIDDDAKKAGSGKSYGKPTARFKVWADGRGQAGAAARRGARRPRRGEGNRPGDDGRAAVDRLGRRERRLARGALHLRGRREGRGCERPVPDRAAGHPHAARQD